MFSHFETDVGWAWSRRRESDGTTPVRYYSRVYIVTGNKRRKGLHEFYMLERKAKPQTYAGLMLLYRLSICVLELVADLVGRTISETFSVREWRMEGERGESPHAMWCR